MPCFHITIQREKIQEYCTSVRGGTTQQEKTSKAHF